jgi:hypothetical protein
MDWPRGRGDGEKVLGMPDSTGFRISKTAGIVGLALRAFAAQLSSAEMLPTMACT